VPYGHDQRAAGPPASPAAPIKLKPRDTRLDRAAATAPRVDHPELRPSPREHRKGRLPEAVIVRCADERARVAPIATAAAPHRRIGYIDVGMCHDTCGAPIPNANENANVI